ncbi:Zinc finger BED domain-containing protein DAYSLEEPER [Rhynchospora pubera]|uniref:Zinc finger BED domain-containing protein DAYSLEEPER n=1 Tax=Rhynchospora pubera TaxID=906938 RepID=A0AAV8G360_9POAL|nr:Zinc finger BED domain-containing protein DAYSLEEPER [Rhynchospora pubera]
MVGSGSERLADIPEEDISDDDIGAGLHFETQEEIKRIQKDAPNDPNNPNTTGQDGEKEPPCEEEGANPKKRKTKKVTAKVWQYFNKGPVDEEGSYSAICKYCGVKYLQGQQRGTASMRNHIDKGCKKFPRNRRDALQKMLQAAKSAEGTELIPWVFDQMKCRKALAMMDEIRDIRDTMKYIKHSQGKMEKFKLACSQSQISFKKPAWDVPTRWNSTYLMLVLALELKPALCRYNNLDKRYYLKPAEFKCDAVECLVSHLKVFYEATLKLSGTKYPTLNLFFPGFAEVYLSIKRMPSSPFPFIVQMGAEMTDKFDKYWSIVMRTELECQRGKKTTAVAGASGSGSATNSRAALKDYIKERKNSEPPKSELEDYLANEVDEATVDEDFDILAWWRLKSPKYPILSQLTKDILDVPISTVASESAFSTSDRILSPARSSLNDESIEALLCAQDWLRASINKKGEKIGEPLWTIDEGGSIED